MDQIINPDPSGFQLDLPDPDKDGLSNIEFLDRLQQAWTVCEKFDLHTDIWRGRILRVVRDREKRGGQGRGAGFLQWLRDMDISKTRAYSLIQLAIPMGGGIKIAVNESFNIMLEYGIRKTFTDYLDDVSTTFVGGPSSGWDPLMEIDNQEMSDPYSLHERGDQRGDPDKKDWYSFAGITLSFKLQKASNCPPY